MRRIIKQPGVVPLAVVGILAIGIVAAAFALNFQANKQTGSSPSSTPPVAQEEIVHRPLQAITDSGSLSGVVSTDRPHYFLREGNPPSGVPVAAFSNNVVYNGGPTMHTSINYAIFWLPNGNSFEQTSGTDAAYMSLIERFLNDTAGTLYYNILSQYPDNINGTPVDKSVLGGSYIDTRSYPATGTSVSPLHDSDIQNEVTNAMKANKWIAGPNKIFHVFTGYGIESCYDPGNSQCTFNVYCAYHNFFAQGAQTIIYSNMPDFNGPSGHCTPRGLSPPNGDYYADPEINILSHELFEAVSDPLLNAWHDASSEIGDKCAWNFGIVASDGSNIVLNGHKYLVQLEWSNSDNTCALSYGPSHIVSIVASPGSTLYPSTIIFNITYTGQMSTWWTDTAYTNGTLSLRVDQNTKIIITNKTPANSEKEKWCFDQNCGDVSFNSGFGTTTTYYYYDLLAQQVSISAGASLPSASLEYRTGPASPSSLGLPHVVTIQLSKVPQTIWVQRGTTASVTSPTDISVNTRWVVGTATWIIYDAFQIPNPIVYYPQYLTTFGFAVTGGGSYYSPAVTYYDAGLSNTVQVGTAVWVDSASAYTYQSELLGSTQYERWSTSSPVGLVSSPGATITTNYYHQYNFTVSYRVTGGTPATRPVLTGETYGLNSPIDLSSQPFTIWLDAGSSYSLTGTLSGTSQERWQAAGATSGILSGATVVSLDYHHQYFLTIQGALPGSSGQGWYDDGLAVRATSPGTYGTSATTRSRLVSYSIDNGLSILLTTRGQVSVSITMSLSHILQFSSTRQYSLTSVLPRGSIDSATASPTGDSWYDDGTDLLIVLNRNWDATDNTRQSLVSYSIDNMVKLVDRTARGLVQIPIVTMSASHIVSAESVLQYPISVQGATVSGSQTDDGWFDSGSQFTIQGAYTRAYTASAPFHAYTIPTGFQILANTTVASIVWAGSSHALTFTANQAEITVYIPPELNLIPSSVLNNGGPIAFSYSPSSGLLSFRGSSDFVVDLSNTGGTSPAQPLIPDVLLYPLTIGIVVMMILVLGLLLIKRGSRKTTS